MAGQAHFDSGGTAGRSIWASLGDGSQDDRDLATWSSNFLSMDDAWYRFWRKCLGDFPVGSLCNICLTVNQLALGRRLEVGACSGGSVTVHDLARSRKHRLVGVEGQKVIISSR